MSLQKTYPQKTFSQMSENTLANTKKINLIQQISKKNKYTYDQVQSFAVKAIEMLEIAEEKDIEKDGEIEAYKEILDQAQIQNKQLKDENERLRSKEQGYIKEKEESYAKEVDDEFIDKVNNSQLTVVGNNRFSAIRAQKVNDVKNIKLEYLKKKNGYSQFFN